MLGKTSIQITGLIKTTRQDAYMPINKINLALSLTNKLCGIRNDMVYSIAITKWKILSPIGLSQSNKYPIALSRANTTAVITEMILVILYIIQLTHFYGNLHLPTSLITAFGWNESIVTKTTICIVSFHYCPVIFFCVLFIFSKCIEFQWFSTRKFYCFVCI